MTFRKETVNSHLNETYIKKLNLFLETSEIIN